MLFRSVSQSRYFPWEGTAQGKIGAGVYGNSGITGVIVGGTNTTITFGPGTLANVQLEFGSIASPFEHRPVNVELDQCRRYYEILSVRIVSAAKTGISDYVTWFFKTTKRATPTITYVGTTAAGVDSITVDGVVVYSASSTAAVIGAGTYADARL